MTIANTASSATEEPDALERRRRQAIAIEQGPLIMRNAYESVGMPWPPAPNGLSYEELKELAYRERGLITL